MNFVEIKLKYQNDFDFIDYIYKLDKINLDILYKSYLEEINKFEIKYNNYEERKDFARLLPYFYKAFEK